jgi:hypothetical protein
MPTQPRRAALLCAADPECRIEMETNPIECKLTQQASRLETPRLNSQKPCSILVARKGRLSIMENVVGVFVFLVVVGFWAFILYILWGMLQSLQSIDHSVSELANSLRNQKST